MDGTKEDLLRQLGPLALSARLKRLSDQMNAEARTLYAELDLPIEPSFYLVFLCLEAHGELGVMALTKMLGWSHPSVIALVRRMTERDLVRANVNPKDKRSTLVSLTKQGTLVLRKAKPIWEAARAGIAEMLDEAGPGTLAALSALEAAHARHGFYERTKKGLRAS